MLQFEDKLIPNLITTTLLSTITFRCQN